MIDSLRRHWPEYAMEAALLGLFMISAAGFATLLEYPESPVRRMLDSAPLRRVLMGCAMGLTALALIGSPWGQRSGAHMNPATTLTFFRLGKVAGADALFYVIAQFAGGVAGLALAAAALGAPLGSAEVAWVATRPGSAGVSVAFAAEAGITFLLMLAVLTVSNRARLARFTPAVVATLVALFISVEAPLSGMSMNPARSFAPALVASLWSALWVYFAAPPIGMLLAAEIYTRLGRAHRVYCAKLHHHNSKRCIFRCEYPALAAEIARNLRPAPASNGGGSKQEISKGA